MYLSLSHAEPCCRRGWLQRVGSFRRFCCCRNFVNFESRSQKFVGRESKEALEEALGADQAADRCYTRQRQVEGCRSFIANRSQGETLDLHRKPAAIAVIG